MTSLLSGCCLFRGYRSPGGIERWQDTSQPKLSLRAKAGAYQERIESYFQTLEGLLCYRRNLLQPELDSYGNLSDGCFHTGIYLASQALRFAVTREQAAEREVWRALDGLKLLLEVTGKRGLLARHFSPAGSIQGGTWRPSPTHPAYVYRGDVSKDQYAGFMHGLGVALAVMEDPRVRARVAELSSAAADHLIENDFSIIDAGGRQTEHGDLQGWIWGLPRGVNALIALLVMKVAAESTGGERYLECYRELVRKGYPGLTHWAHIRAFDSGRRVNENLAYLALYPLLLLEKKTEVLDTLRDGERRIWKHLRDERNAFFSFVHGRVGSGGPAPAGSGPRSEGGERGREALLEFPDDKVEWPVDLTREGFRFRRAFFNAPDCIPRAKRAIPLHLRPKSSSFWASNPYRLVGALGSRGDIETAGADYLLAYWLGRYHGFLSPED